jgi:hypothetical protein
MSGKGEPVRYNRFVAQTPEQKAALKDAIAKIIDGAAYTITVESMAAINPDPKK